MNGPMVSLIILLMAGTAEGQLTQEAAATRPGLDPRSLSVLEGNESTPDDGQGSGSRGVLPPQPDEFLWPDGPSLRSSLGAQTKTRLAKIGGQTNFSGRSDRSDKTSSGGATALPSPRSFQQLKNFSVPLTERDLESIRRGDTLAAPVRIETQDHLQLDPGNVGSIAFFHTKNASREKLPVERVEPLPLEPGSRRLRFRVSQTQLNQLKSGALQFMVPDSLRGEYDEIDFAIASQQPGFNTVPDAGSRPSETNQWNTSAPSGSSRKSAYENQFASSPGDGRNSVNSNPSIGQNGRRNDRANGSRDSSLPFDQDLVSLNDPPPTNSRFSGLASRQQGRDQPGFGSDSMPIAAGVRGRLDSMEARLQEKEMEAKQWRNEAELLRREKTELKQKMLTRAELASMTTTTERPPSGLRPSFGNDRGDFSNFPPSHSRALEIAKQRINELEQKNQNLDSEVDFLANENKKMTNRGRVGPILPAGYGRGNIGFSDSSPPRLADASSGIRPTGLAASTRGPLSGGRSTAAPSSPPSKAGGGAASESLAGEKTGQFETTGKTDDKTLFGFLWVLLLISVGANIYFGALCRSWYLRYQDLGDELREMLTTSTS